MSPPPPPPPPTDRERLVNRVVVAFLDGTRVRGFVYDVHTERGDFHLYASDAPDETSAQLIKLKDIKAIFFVRSLTGNPQYRENKTELTQRRRWGRPFEVVFHDGERMVGMVEIFHKERIGFYIVPPDPRSNNLRIFVVMSTVRSVKPLDEKTGEGRDGVWEVPDPAIYPLPRRTEIVLRLLRDGDAEKLSNEVFLPVPIIEYWQKTFVDAGFAALSDEALLAARRAEDPEHPPEKPDRTPQEKRLDIVLRLFAKEEQAVLSQVFLVPYKLLAEWRERFLEAGKRALAAQAGDESAIARETVQSKYERIVAEAAAPERDRDDFLDSLDDLFKDAPPGGG